MAGSISTWIEKTFGIKAISSFLAKKEVPRHGHSYLYYTGSTALFFFAIQIATGILLALYYRPTLAEANLSVGRIMTELPLGWLVRSIHSWSATFMIATVFVHLLGIAFTKAYRPPREATWLSGVFLLVASLAFGFTGYLLPWDDLSLSATKVGTDIPHAIPVVGAWLGRVLRGGSDVTGDTLSRFFIIHVCVLPLALLAFLGIHLFLVQRHGMSLPLAAERAKVKLPVRPFWPNFVFREAGVWLVLLGILLTIAAFFAPSLGPPADLMAPAPEGIKPEWYFLFLFQTLKLPPANVGFVPGETLAILAILAVGVVFLLLPFIDNKPHGKKGRIVTWLVGAGLAYAVALTAWSLVPPNPAGGAQATSVAGAAPPAAKPAEAPPVETAKAETAKPAPVPSAQEAKPAAPPAKPAAKANSAPPPRTETIYPVEENPRRKVALAVFLPFLWLVIAVLLYFIRLRVREADRVHAAGYFHPASRSKPGPAGPPEP